MTRQLLRVLYCTDHTDVNPSCARLDPSGGRTGMSAE